MRRQHFDDAEPLPIGRPRGRGSRAMPDTVAALPAQDGGAARSANAPAWASRSCASRRGLRAIMRA
ncbi:MAG: hypothetical protein MZW92_09780 [Comamonadaceae bacterium]|nr:hypothetical protein [Comamonadaceae bacterium]